MAFVNGLNNIMNLSEIGSGWQPKSSRIRVGRDVGALTATVCSGQATRNTVIGNGDDVTLKSKDLFNQVKIAAQKGYGFRQFRSITDQDLKDGTIYGGGTVHQSGDYKASFAGNRLTVQKGDYSVSIQDGRLGIYKKSEEEGAPPIPVMTATITEDARLVWNENGEPELLTGSAARTKGILQAQSENEVILSLSGSDVKAGEGTVVWNLSGKAGAYSGGNNVTYLGTYDGGKFTDIEGKVTFGGYFNKASFSNISGISEFSGVFEEAAVVLGEGHGTFSGYFSASEIIGAAINTMSGLFLNACTVQGGEGDDNFNGRFIGGNVDGGEGDNTFGYAALNLTRELVGSNSINGKTYPLNYKGAEADFINTTVTAGSGKDHVNAVSWGSSFDLGEGDDSTEGIFSKTIINGGGGNDTLRAMYAVDSTFDTGVGDDSLSLITAVSNAIVTGDGANTITMGLNYAAASATTWQTRDEYFNNARPRETGELARNAIDASRGENAITVNNGEASRRVAIRDKHTGDNSGGENEADAAAVAAPQGEGLPLVTDTAMRAAIARYREVFGMEPQNKGETAVTIDYGDGSEESFMSARREDTRADREETGIIRTVQRYGVDGAISWQRWQRA